MEKNQNGYSAFNFGNRSGLDCRGEQRNSVGESSDGKVLGENTENGTNNQAMNGNGCSQKQLAMVYSPYQCFRMIYSPMDALAHGTLFEELYKPLMEDGKNG